MHKRRGIGMFVSPDARQRLLSQRRERFFADLVDPMVAQAKLLGISLTDVIKRIEQSGTHS